MLFREDLARKVMSGVKTQTRRISKAGESAVFGPNLEITAVASQVSKWRVGFCYGVQPGRGKRAIGRIRITAIRSERLRSITLRDVLREGFASVNQFASAWDMLNRHHPWRSNPHVWVLEFELA